MACAYLGSVYYFVVDFDLCRVQTIDIVTSIKPCTDHRTGAGLFRSDGVGRQVSNNNIVMTSVVIIIQSSSGTACKVFNSPELRGSIIITIRALKALYISLKTDE